MAVLGMCTNRGCFGIFTTRPVPDLCPNCKVASVIQTCPNPVCNELISEIVIDPRRLPEVCPACSTQLRFNPS